MPNRQLCRGLLALLLAVAVCGAAGRASAACDGGLWVDARCAGAAGNGAADDTAALRRAIRRALAADVPLLLRAGTYKVTQGLVIDYRTRATTGFRLISRGAIIDGRTISGGPTLRIECSGGSAAAPKGCFYFHQEGTLLVYANADAYAVVIGKEDFSDAHNSAKIDHLIVNNAGGGVHAGGLQLNYVLDSAIFAVGDTAGGAAGIALEQTQFSHLSGARARRAASGSSSRPATTSPTRSRRSISKSPRPAWRSARRTPPTTRSCRPISPVRRRSSPPPATRRSWSTRCSPATSRPNSPRPSGS